MLSFKTFFRHLSSEMLTCIYKCMNKLILFTYIYKLLEWLFLSDDDLGNSLKVFSLNHLLYSHSLFLFILVIVFVTFSHLKKKTKIIIESIKRAALLGICINIHFCFSVFTERWKRWNLGLHSKCFGSFESSWVYACRNDTTADDHTIGVC